MAVLKIKKYPSDVLKQVAKPIEKITPEIKKFLDDMAETMYETPGVGLAAPQVGKSLRCIVLKVGHEEPDGTVKHNTLHLINPEISQASGEIEWEEGCLSVPDFTIMMKRAKKIHVKALDINENVIEFDAEDLFAVVVQHEVDHLDGKLLIDNISSSERETYVKEQEKKHLRDEHEPAYL